TTLGRGGSDYTAALAGAAIGAEVIEIWTDVSGVLTADPRLVAGVYTQSHLSYAELMELSHFGAKVVHPPTVHPARLHGIPLQIKNTFDPEQPGTLVTAEAAPANTPIRGIASVPKVALAQLEGDGMVGVPGIAERLFGALAHRGVSAILISQGSSEHSICFAIDEADAEATRRAIESEFELERRLGMVDDLIVEEQHTVVAAVGEQMAHRPGIAGQLFGVLGAYGVNVRAIAQGSSELNISLVVEARDERRAVRAIHEAFFAPRRCRVDLVIAGVGWVGGALLEQIAESRERLLADDGLDLRVVAVLSSRKIVIDPEGLDPATAKARLAAEAEQPRETIEASIDDILSTANGAGKIFVDCSASPTLGTRYLGLLEDGIAVVAANKKPFSGPQADWDAMRTAERDGGAPLLFETTAGAALPVLGTLRGLRRTGDQVGRIDAVLSGTLNAVLDTLSADVPFSESVRQAFDAGLTEPHPYEDLSGFDVARKLIILARLAGHRLEPDEVDVEPLLAADPWAETDLDTFWQRLPELDEAFEARRAAAAERGCRLRYLATLDLESIEVSAKIA
ncbi:MAG: aspartate kinase, partial [Acidobacteriota bacterium]